MTISKIVYAQSSDIKSRSHLEYRRDMKKKAIAELEFLPLLQNILAKRYDDPSLTVKKHGGDAHLWFSPNGKINRDPDYIARHGNNRSSLYEFQYAEKTTNLSHFDFKLSKVGIKKEGQRIPHKDREFFYVVKPEAQYAFISPDWIMSEGTEGSVPAWGSRAAYRIPANKFKAILQDGDIDMQNTIRAIDEKNTLLTFQHEFLNLEAKKLSNALQKVIDDKQIIKIMPSSLQGFYEVCFILNSINKTPVNCGAWMVYLISLFNEKITAIELAQFMFTLDFLYFKCEEIKPNEETALINVIKQVTGFVTNYPSTNGFFTKNPKESPAEETRQVLFSLNLLEDLTQDVVINLKADLPLIKKIFQSVNDLSQKAMQIKRLTQAKISID